MNLVSYFPAQAADVLDSRNNLKGDLVFSSHWHGADGQLLDLRRMCSGTFLLQLMSQQIKQCDQMARLFIQYLGMYKQWKFSQLN